MKTKYAFQGMKENMAKAITKDAGISTKVSIEIANFLRGKTSKEAKIILEKVLKKKQAIPFKKFTNGLGHRKGAGITSGRYPEKATEAFLTIIKQCEANAQAKGLYGDLKIVHLVAQKGTNAFHQGRQRRRRYKRTHLEIVLEEQEAIKKSKKTETSKEEKATEHKTEILNESKSKKTIKEEKTLQEEKSTPKKTIKKTTKKITEEQK